MDYVRDALKRHKVRSSETAKALLTLFISIFVLSVGAPGVPGSALICLSILLPQTGIPAVAISIVMGLYTLAGMMLACVNVTGDAVITLITAKKEHRIDPDVFRSKDTQNGAGRAGSREVNNG